MHQRVGTRSYVAEHAERTSNAPSRNINATAAYDDGRIVVNVNCGGNYGAPGPNFGGCPGYGYGAVLPTVVPTLPGLWPLPPLSANYGNLPANFIYGATPWYGGPPALLPPMMTWPPYAVNSGSICG